MAIRHKGIALVITLAAVVLLTVLVVAFFSRAVLNRQVAFTSTNMVRTDLLARGAAEIVVGEVRQEILDGSTPLTDSGVTFYPPTAAKNATLEKVGVAAPSSDVDGKYGDAGKYTIAKVSANNAPIRPAGTPIGSDVSLDVASANGRSAASWFSAGPQLGNAKLPAWVYLGRNGITVNPTVTAAKNRASSDYVIGRFAYTVYDTGGLLDANVAGYPMSNPFAMASKDTGTKSSVAYADLTQVGTGTNAVDALVKWRNPVTGTNAESFNEWATGIPRIAGTPNALSLVAARSGYGQIAVGDQSFVNRRDFLKYAAANNWAATAPQYFTHTSRAMSGPIWSPTANTPATNYASVADQTTSINRRLTGVRHTATSAAAVTGKYNDDGTVSSVKVRAGDLLLQRRFSLARLAWLGKDGPNASAFASTLNDSQKADAIKACFGLTWNEAKHRWDYSHGHASRILTLEEVRQAGREPDFFEILQAVILEGSLGRDPGTTNIGPMGEETTSGAPGTSGASGVVGEDFEYHSAVETRHIFQIGANIIDQADPGNFPTAIYQLSIAETSAMDELFNTVFGVENLPYLLKMDVITAKDNRLDTASMANTWMQPELWNPHYNYTSDSNYPSSTDPQHETPTKLRLVTFGASQAWNQIEDPDGDNLGAIVNFGADPSAPSQDGMVTFRNSRDFFNSPLGLTATYKETPYPGLKNVPLPAGAPSMTDVAQNDFLAVWTGDVTRNPMHITGTDKFGTAINATTQKIKIVIPPAPSPPLTFVLEYSLNGNWYPYTMMARITEMPFQEFAGGGKLTDDPKNRYGRAIPRTTLAHLDPRTDRFSATTHKDGDANQAGIWERSRTAFSQSGATLWKGGLQFGYPNAPGFTNLGSTLTATKNWGRRYNFYEWAINLDVANSANAASDFRYADMDGLTRPGDAFRGDWTVGGTGDGVMLYHQDTKTASAQQRRPVILNRPFQSVAELGYTFRDVPFKTLDLWSDKSADSGLLDVFSISERDEERGVAGLVNINKAPPKVLAAILAGTSKTADGTTGVIAPALAMTLADNITTAVQTTPVANQADLVDKLGATINASLSDKADKANKTYGEAPMRALSSITNARTWNLLIDVVAQTGKISETANNLGSFIVEGERRYWLHVAIDRYSGKVLKRQLEPVYE